MRDEKDWRLDKGCNDQAMDGLLDFDVIYHCDCHRRLGLLNT